MERGAGSGRGARDAAAARVSTSVQADEWAPIPPPDGPRPRARILRMPLSVVVTGLVGIGVAGGVAAALALHVP